MSDDESIFDLLSKSDKSSKSKKETCIFAVAHLATDNVYCIIGSKICAETLAQNWTNPHYCRIHAEAFRMGLQRVIGQGGTLGGRFVATTRRGGREEHIRVPDPDDFADSVRRYWERVPEERERITREIMQPVRGRTREEEERNRHTEEIMAIARAGAARTRGEMIDVTGMTENEAREAAQRVIRGEERVGNYRPGSFIRGSANSQREAPARQRFWNRLIRIRVKSFWHLAAIICCSFSFLLGIGTMATQSYWFFLLPFLTGTALVYLIKAWIISR